ncbi:hypothetical protein FACS189483_04870 [Spirochaetia bacterium]|nr:hypothetical protein FACS189483_04870 [Spirochaetia bacterium]
MGAGKDDFESLMAFMPEGWEAKAKELGALQQAQNVKTAEELRNPYRKTCHCQKHDAYHNHIIIIGYVLWQFFGVKPRINKRLCVEYQYHIMQGACV